MKILVTGGSGFIGSHLVDILLEQKHEVLIYDKEAPRYNQKCGSVIADTGNLEQLVSESKGFDYIYHLAAEANVNIFFENPLYSNINTSHNTLNVLEAQEETKSSAFC